MADEIISDEKLDEGINVDSPEDSASLLDEGIEAEPVSENSFADNAALEPVSLEPSTGMGESALSPEMAKAAVPGANTEGAQTKGMPSSTGDTKDASGSKDKVQSGDSKDRKPVEEAKEEPVNLVVDGFEFLSKEDAKKAELDKQKIAILGKKVRSTKISDLEAVYEKAISSKIFSTPVGWIYLAKLRDRLIQGGVAEEDLIPIPVNFKITKVDLKDEYHPRQYITPVPQKKKKDKKAVAIVLVAMNLILVAMVVAMFYITMNSESDNILNYKNNVTNRYAEWEESLKEREKAVRIKERDLKIQDNTDFENGIDLDVIEDALSD